MGMNEAFSPYPDIEPRKILILRDKLIDPARQNRPVKIKLYHPVIDLDEQEKYPLILWSHGLGGSVNGASFISRFIAAHGYIVLHVQHDGTDSSLWEGKKGHPWDVIRNTVIPRRATLARFSDIPFVLGAIAPWLQENYPDVARQTDFSNIGMSGHSFGAMTTQVMCGMMFPDESGILRSFKEPRLKCGLLYSPVPIQHLALDDPEDIYGTMDTPMLFMTGTEDSSPVEGWDYTKRLVVYNYCGSADKAILILNHGDHMVYNGSRGKLGQSPYRKTHEKLIKILSLAYWDAKLKNDPAARDWLTGSGVQNFIGDDGAFR